MAKYGGAYTPSLLSFICDDPETNANDTEDTFDIQNINPVDIAIGGTRAYWEGGMPSNLIGIANDCMGNLFCFERLPVNGLIQDDVPILLFDHDYVVVRRVSSSFTELLQWFLRYQGAG